MLGCQNSIIGWLCGPTGWYYKIAWFALSPLFLLVRYYYVNWGQNGLKSSFQALFISSLINQVSYNMTYGTNERLYTYPEWSKIIAWSLVFASFLWIPAFGVYRVIRNYQRGKVRYMKRVRWSINYVIKYRHGPICSKFATTGALNTIAKKGSIRSTLTYFSRLTMFYRSLLTARQKTAMLITLSKQRNSTLLPIYFGFY